MGNRQGSKAVTRQDSVYRQTKKHPVKVVDGSDMGVSSLSPPFPLDDFHTFAFHSSVSPNTCLHTTLHPKGGGRSGHGDDTNPDLLARILQDGGHDIHTCHPADPRIAYLTEGIANNDVSEISFAHGALSSSSTVKSVHIMTSRGVDEQCSTCLVSSGESSSLPITRKWLDTDSEPEARRCIGDDSFVDVNHTRAHCIDKLEELKRHIEQSMADKLMHFSNTGSAQLQSEADYDNTDYVKDPEKCERQGALHKDHVGISQIDTQSKSKYVRKLSEPWYCAKRKDSVSSKSISALSRSAETSPVIVRKALPHPGSPVVVQRTPSQSPSVERRFPANASAGAELLDSPTSRLPAYHKLSPETPDIAMTTEVAHNISRQKTTDTSLSLISKSPVLFRKIPESSILLPGLTDLLAKRTTHCHQTPSFAPVQTCGKHHARLPQLSCLCSQAHNRQHLPLQGDIPMCTSSTSSLSAALCATSPTPIQVCPQPRGTPVKECILLSQPSTAVVVASGQSQVYVHTTKNIPFQYRKDAETVAKEVQTHTPTHSQDTCASSQPQTDTAVVTEDTIKQISQSAVFGSVSPKLMRHRRLLKENPNSVPNEQTFPNPSLSTQISSNSESGNRVNVAREAGSSAQIGNGMRRQMAKGEKVNTLSHCNPSSSFSDKTSLTGSCIGFKNLGQRIREVINESTVRTTLNGKLSSSSFGKYDRLKDNSFPDSSVTSSSHSLPRRSTRSTEGSLYDITVPAHKTEHVASSRTLQTEKGIGELSGKLLNSHENTVTDFHVSLSVGYSYHLNSFRDSCSSCVCDSNQMRSVENRRQIAELTQANLSRQTELLSEGTESNMARTLTHLGVSGRRLVASDTMDTLSTDRETSGSSKRESSTSTATDDTLTSFKTRSTSDSADFEGFALPESLVFVRSENKENIHNDAAAFAAEQMAVKRRLGAGVLPSPHAPYQQPTQRTRKKRRTQMLSQTVTSRTSQAKDKQVWNRDIQEMYSDEISDGSELFSSEDDISDLPSSRDDISDLPSSRDDITDLPISRHDISLLPKHTDISSHSSSKTILPDLFSSSIDDISNNGTTQRHVFNRREQHPPLLTHKHSFQGNDGGSVTTNPTTHGDSPHVDSMDLDFEGSWSSSYDSSDTFVKSSECLGDDTMDAGIAPEEFGTLTFVPQPSNPRQHVQVPARSRSTRQRRRLPATSAARSGNSECGGDRDRRDGLKEDTSASPSRHDEEEGKELLFRRYCSPESTKNVVLSCTIYNSSCRSFDAE